MPGLEADATALDEVGDGGESFPAGSALAADGENQRV
jgi:hypothetical protein